MALSGYIEKYKDTAGKYPFQGESEVPLYTLVATKEQMKYIQGGPPYKHVKRDSRSLLNELQSVLGSDVQLPFDPQRVPVNKPIFYIYRIVNDVYHVAVHVHNDLPFANKLGPYYNKVEVTNNQAKSRPGTWYRPELLNNTDFIAFINRPPIKPGYVESLRKRLGGNAAF